MQLLLEDEVGAGNDVCAAERQQQKHFNRPLAEAAHLQQLLGNLAVGHVGKFLHVNFAAVDGFSEAAQIINLLRYKADGQQLFRGHSEHCLRRNRLACQAFQLLYKLLADVGRQLLGNDARE